MARLTAGLVVSAVMLIILGVGVTPGINGQGVNDLLAGVGDGMALSYFATSPTMRITSSKDPNLCLAARGGFVLVTQKSLTDRSQAWIQDSRAIGVQGTEDECRKPFALVNFDVSTSTLRAIVPPSNDPSDPAELAPYDPFKCVRPSMLWTKGNPNLNGFYTINMFGDRSRAFNSLKGAFVGAALGVRPTDGVSPNVLWKIEPFFAPDPLFASALSLQLGLDEKLVTR